jgi:selenocysteine lyase/cysteine desulfurase
MFMLKTELVTPTYDLQMARAAFEVTRAGLAYLNHAGMSPLPTPTRLAMMDMIEAIAAAGSTQYQSLLDPLLERLFDQVGQLVNALPEEIAFVENTSTGLNIVAQSLPLKAGDNILLCDVEFPSNVYPWMNLTHKGVETRLIPAVDGGLSLEGLDAHRDGHSRVVAVSGVQFFTGRREDLVSIGQYCADHGLWLVVDAIQAASVVPLDMRAMGIHALAAGGQKALCAPPGQGFMVIRSELIEQMRPIFVGPVSVQGWERWLQYDMTPNAGARRFDMGTINAVGLAGLSASLGFLLELGISNISNWVTHLGSIAIADLKARGYQVITPEDPVSHAHIVTFEWPGDPLYAVEVLREQGVILREHLDTAGNPHLRMSAHCYNTEEEVLCVGAILEGIRHEQH